MLKLLLLMLPALVYSNWWDLYSDEQSGFVFNIGINRISIPMLGNGADKECCCPVGFDCSTIYQCQREFKMIVELDDGTRLDEDTIFTDSNCNIQHMGGFQMHVPTIPKSIHLTLAKWRAVPSEGEDVSLDNVTHNTEMDFNIPLENLRLSTFGDLDTIQRATVHDTFYKDIVDRGSLDVYYSITCLHMLTGKSCDLKCLKLKNNTQSAHCVHVKTADFFKCKHVGNGEVGQCEKYIRNETAQIIDQEDKQCIQEGFVVQIEWKVILIAIGIVLLSVALGTLLGIKIANRSANRQKEKMNDCSVSHSTLVNL